MEKTNALKKLLNGEQIKRGPGREKSEVFIFSLYGKLCCVQSKMAKYRRVTDCV